MKPLRIPPLARDLIQTSLLSLDGMEFSYVTSCTSCGGTLAGHDHKIKQFVVLREGTGERVISVRVKRFRCRNCGHLWYADEPFYPGTRFGSPVIDLFLSLSSTMPPSRAARIIDSMGIVIDRTTWKNYVGRFSGRIPAMDVFGMRLPLSIMRLSDVSVRYGETGMIDPDEIIRACGYPSRNRRETGS